MAAPDDETLETTGVAAPSEEVTAAGDADPAPSADAAPAQPNIDRIADKVKGMLRSDR